MPSSPKSALSLAVASLGVVFSVATSQVGPPAMGGLSAVLPDEHREELAPGASVSFPLHIAVHATAGVSFSSLEVVASLEPTALRNAFGVPEDELADAGPGADAGDAGPAEGAEDETAPPDEAVLVSPVFRMTIAFAGAEGPIADEIVNASTFRDLSTEILGACFGNGTCDATDDLVLTFTRLDQGADTASLFWRAGAQISYAEAMEAPEGDTLTIAIAGPDEVPAGDDDAGTPAAEDAGAPVGDDAGEPAVEEDAGAPAGDDAGA